MNPLKVLRDCVSEAGGDLAVAVLAADYIFSTSQDSKDGIILAHVAGPSGSGQTTLVRELAKSCPDVAVRDMDEFDAEAEKALGLKGRDKSTYTDKTYRELLERRQDIQDKFVARSDRPVVLIGNHTEGDYTLKISTKNKFLLDVSAKVSARRAYERSQEEGPESRRTLEELPDDEKEAREKIAWLREHGYVPMSSKKIIEWVHHEVGSNHSDDDSSALSLDVANKQALLILNRSMRALRKLTTDARRELGDAADKAEEDGGATILRFIDKYRLELARVLTTSQLAAVLEGMREVAATIPTLATFPGAVPIPPTLSPAQASALVERVAGLDGDERGAATYELPPDQQVYVAQAIAAREAGPVTPPPPKFGVVASDDEDEGDVHLTMIDAAVQELSAKNVLTREAYDSLGSDVRAKAFTVAGIEATELLTKVRDVLAENVRKGADHASFRQEVLAAVGEGTFLSPGHQETVFRTNVQSAFSDGQMLVLGNPLVQSGFPYAAYDAIHDSRVRDDHKALETSGLNGTNVYRIDDPVFRMFRPPWDYGCRCGWTPTTVRAAAEAGVTEAQEWLQTGVEPTPPAHVQMPPFAPRSGFQRGAGAPMSVIAAGAPMGFLGGAALAEGRWVTIGGKPNVDRGVEHEGGTPVQIDEHGTVLKGKRVLRGHNVREAGSRLAKSRPSHRRGKRGVPSGRQPGGDSRGTGVGPGGGPDAVPAQGPGGRVAASPERPGDAQVGGVGEAAGQPAHTRPAETVPGGAGAGGGAGTTGTDPGARAKLDKVNRRLDRYSAHFQAKGNGQAAEWMQMLREHVNAVGVDATLAALGEEPQQQAGPSERVGYRSTGEANVVGDDEAKFISDYLDRAGIVMQPQYDPNPAGMRVLASAPTETAQAAAREGDVVPAVSTLRDKLEESKSLPGLESTEDIDVIMGVEGDTESNNVTRQVTPEVIKKLDERFGEGQWIIKSYGEEAYAGFGVIFPQRAAAFQQAARQTIHEVTEVLKKVGVGVARGPDGTIVGLQRGADVIRFDDPEFAAKVKHAPVIRVAKMLRAASYAENGAVLPGDPEESLRQNFRITLRRGPDGNLVGLTDEGGNDVRFDLLRDAQGTVIGVQDTPEYAAFRAESDKEDGGHITHEIDRAVAAVYNKAKSVRYMAQPAFEAVGVTEAERALGATWETGTEGRVHVVIKDGKASVVPYATLASRGDAMPAVFADDNVRAMERAAQEAIDALPESERIGQVYAPDVMKTKDGWRVVEVNASGAEASSLWLEQNPLVIDAYVAHLTGRQPMHVSFIRNLLRDRMRGSKVQAEPVDPSAEADQSPGKSTGAAARKLAGGKPFGFDEEDHPRKPKGSEEGGQFKEKDDDSNVIIVKSGKLKATYSRHKPKKVRDGVFLKLPDYRQEDPHSCGFVAAMVVMHYFDEEVDPKDVLRAVSPTIKYGVDRYSLISSLEELGITTNYRGNLSVKKLRRLVENGYPVIVSVWPEDYETDHWVVVRGFDDDLVYLTNHSPLTYDEFREQWSDMDMRGRGNSREGIVCDYVSDDDEDDDDEGDEE